MARRAFPVTAGVPLPSGRVARPDAVWLARPDGRPAPVQTRALERWPDGSVRWLLIDFLADVPANGRAVYTLRDGRPSRGAPGPRLGRVLRGGAHVLDAGSLRVAVPLDGSVAVRELVAGSARTGPIALPTLAADGAGVAQPGPARVGVETDGPIRTELLLTGRDTSGLARELRLAVFAGQPFVRLQQTITDLGDAPYLPVRGLVLTVPGRFTSGTVGVDGVARVFDSLDPAHTLRHADATPALLDGEPAGRHGEAWARARGDGAVTLVARWFWQEYPKAFRLAPDGLSLDLLAGDTDPVLLGVGAAKTTELWVALEPADRARDAAQLARALRSPLVALPPASWTAASRALPQALDPDGPGARAFLDRLARALDSYVERIRSERWDDGPPIACVARTSERPRIGLYGALNWGDWQFPRYRDSTRGCDGWGNLEYDLTQVLALGWASTGDRIFWDLLGPAALHYRDVDIIHHFPGHPDWVGLNHPHKAGHFAVAAPETVDLGHTWAEGLVSHWRLTGEVRSLAAARALADALVPRVHKARNPRQFGWPMLALVAVHDATGERRHLEAARAYAEAGTAAFRPTPTAGDWKMGILADGIAAVHAAGGDVGLRRWLVAYADAYVAEPDRFADPRFALPLGYLAALTGDARYRTAALDAAAHLRLGGWGKPIAAMGRTGFRLLAPLATSTGQASAPASPDNR